MNQKFGENGCPDYCIKEIFPEQLEIIRHNAHHIKFDQLPGSSKIRIMIFEPNSTLVQVAPYLCICEKCLNSYGTCNLFETHNLQSTPKPQKNICLRKDDDNEDNDGDRDEDEEIDPEYYADNTICAIAADKGSLDMFYFIFINENCIAEFDTRDDFKHPIKEGRSTLHIWLLFGKIISNN